jgi:hypothetical protein
VGEALQTANLAGDVSVILDLATQRIYARTAGAVFSLDSAGNKIAKQAFTAHLAQPL